MTPETTLDDLAEAVATGFRQVDKRFDEVNAKLDRIESAVLADHARRITRLEEALTPSRR